LLTQTSRLDSVLSARHSWRLRAPVMAPPRRPLMSRVLKETPDPPRHGGPSAFVRPIAIVQYPLCR